MNEFSRRCHTWERFISTSILNSSNITVVKQTSISPLWASTSCRLLRLANLFSSDATRSLSLSVSSPSPFSRDCKRPSASLIWSSRSDITSRTKRWLEYDLAVESKRAQWLLLTSIFSFLVSPIFLWDERQTRLTCCLLLLKDDPFAAKIRRRE